MRLRATPIRPIAGADVVAALADVATGEPLGGTPDVAGPDRFTLDEIGRLTLAAREDRRPVLVDDRAGLFAAVPGGVLAPAPAPAWLPHRYRDWLAAAR